MSGLSAAHTIYQAGGNVVVLDKQGFFGGNSTKVCDSVNAVTKTITNTSQATSGINGALTRTQVDQKIPDSVKTFYNDTLKSARDKARPDLIKVLTYKSASAVEWLQDEFNLDLTLVSRLGYVTTSSAITCSETILTCHTEDTLSQELTVDTMLSSQVWPSPTH